MYMPPKISSKKVKIECPDQQDNLEDVQARKKPVQTRSFSGVDIAIKEDV